MQWFKQNIYIAVFLVIGVFVGGVLMWQRSSSLAPHRASITFPSVTVTAEVADTVALQTQGLSGRVSLGSLEGMFFTFDFPSYHTFWMKDMEFPLDFIWIREGNVIGVTKDAPPEGKHPTKTYAPPSTIDAVLEVNAGFVEMYGIQVGDTVVLSELIK